MLFRSRTPLYKPERDFRGRGRQDFRGSCSSSEKRGPAAKAQAGSSGHFLPISDSPRSSLGRKSNFFSRRSLHDGCGSLVRGPGSWPGRSGNPVPARVLAPWPGTGDRRVGSGPRRAAQRGWEGREEGSPEPRIRWIPGRGWAGERAHSWSRGVQTRTHLNPRRGRWPAAFGSHPRPTQSRTPALPAPRHPSPGRSAPGRSLRATHCTPSLAPPRAGSSVPRLRIWKRRPRAACGKAPLILHFLPIWRKCHGRERKKKKKNLTVNMIWSGVRARRARGSGRRAARARAPLRGFPVSQRALVDTLPFAGSPCWLQSAIYYSFRSIDNVWDSSNPRALVCNQHIYPHLGGKIRIKSPWPWLGYSVIFPGSSFKSTPHCFSVYYMLI